MASEQTFEKALNERALYLHKVLVEVYIREGQPVGSRTLARTAGLDLSPATIRNVMADLEELGFLSSPHTSAGRVPTAKGFRLFVDNLIKFKPLQLTVLDKLKGGLDPGLNRKGLVETASGLLSGITQMAGIVTVPRKQSTSLRQIEFLELSQNRVLAILVVNEQEVQNRIIQLERGYTRSELEEAANYLNSQFAGQDLRQVRLSLLKELDLVRQDMDRLMRSAVELGEKVFVQAEKADEDFVVVGQTNLMEYEQLSDVESLRQLFDAFSRKREILHLLDRCICAEGVQIFFGQESGYHPLDECSVVSAPYSVDDEVVGVLGVIGPMRMAYDRVIPIVDVTAKLLGAALNPRS
jgi:heat-inducible transcriptional repressor